MSIFGFETKTEKKLKEDLEKLQAEKTAADEATAKAEADAAATAETAQTLQEQVEKLSAGSVENLKNVATKLGKELVSAAVSTGTAVATDAAGKLSEKVTEKFNEISSNDNVQKGIEKVLGVVSLGKGFLKNLKK